MDDITGNTFTITNGGPAHRAMLWLGLDFEDRGLLVVGNLSRWLKEDSIRGRAPNKGFPQTINIPVFQSKFD